MRNSPLRNVLRARVRPMIDRLATDLVDLAAARIETELSRLPEVLGIAVSAFESNAESDLLARALGPELAAMMKEPASEPEPVKYGACGAESGGASEWTCQLPKGHDGCHWSKHVGRWFDPPKPTKLVTTVVDNVSPRIAQVSAQLEKLPKRTDETALQANGKKPPSCSRCGFVGGNARGCGTAHPTQAAPVIAAPLLSQSPNFGPVMTAREAFGPGQTVAPDSTPVALVRSDRRAIIAARAPKAAPRAEPEEENANADERWSPERIEEETELAENRKHDGALPLPRKSYQVANRGGGLAEVRPLTEDLAPEAELDFGAAG